VQGLAFSFSSVSSGLLSWNPAENALRYRVEAIDAVSGQATRATFAGDVTSVTVNGMRAGRTYQFRVVSINDDGATASDWVQVVAGAGLTTACACLSALWWGLFLPRTGPKAPAAVLHAEVPRDRDAADGEAGEQHLQHGVTR